MKRTMELWSYKSHIFFPHSLSLQVSSSERNEMLRLISLALPESLWPLRQRQQRQRTHSLWVSNRCIPVAKAGHLR